MSLEERQPLLGDSSNTRKSGDSVRYRSRGAIIRLLVPSLGMLSAYGFPYGLGVLYSPIQIYFEASHIETASLISTCSAMVLLTGVFGSMLAQRVGVQATSMLGGLCMSVGIGLCYFATDIYYLIFFLGIISGFGSGLLIVSSQISIGQYPSDIRNILFGVYTSVGGFGIMSFQQLLYFLEDKYGLQGCFLVIGGFSLNAAVVGVFYKPAKTKGARMTSSPIFSTELFKNGSFVVWFCLNSLTGYFVDITQSVVADFIVESGYTLEQSVNVATVRNAFDTIGCFSAGLVAKIFPKKFFFIAFPLFLMNGAGMALYPVYTTIDLIYFGAALNGLFLGLWVGLYSIITAYVTGKESFATGFGMMNTARGILDLAGGSVIGVVRDATGSHSMMLYISGGAACLTSVIYITLLSTGRLKMRM